MQETSHSSFNEVVSCSEISQITVAPESCMELEEIAVSSEVISSWLWDFGKVLCRIQYSFPISKM